MYDSNAFLRGAQFSGVISGSWIGVSWGNSPLGRLYSGSAISRFAVNGMGWRMDVDLGDWRDG